MGAPAADLRIDLLDSNFFLLRWCGHVQHTISSLQANSLLAGRTGKFFFVDRTRCLSNVPSAKHLEINTRVNFRKAAQLLDESVPPSIEPWQLAHDHGRPHNALAMPANAELNSVNLL
jgi:hypothetical protein